MYSVTSTILSACLCWLFLVVLSSFRVLHPPLLSCYFFNLLRFFRISAPYSSTSYTVISVRYCTILCHLILYIFGKMFSYLLCSMIVLYSNIFSCISLAISIATVTSSLQFCWVGSPDVCNNQLLLLLPHQIVFSLAYILFFSLRFSFHSTSGIQYFSFFLSFFCLVHSAIVNSFFLIQNSFFHRSLPFLMFCCSQ